MKSTTVSYIINAALILLVGYLYFHHFKNESPVSTVIKTPQGNDTLISIPVSSENHKILYVNIDTLMEKYKWFKQQKAILEKQESTADASLKAKGMKLQNEIVEYQKKAQSGELTAIQAQEIEKNLADKQQAYLAEQEKLTKQLMDKGAKAQEQLMKTIKTHLKNYLVTYEVEYIMAYSEASNILIADEKLDITNQILQKLNALKK